MEPDGILPHSQVPATQFRGVCEWFRTFTIWRWGVVSTSPNPQTEVPPLSAVRDCLFSTLAATLRSSIRNLRTRHAVVTGTHLSFFYRYIHKSLCIVNNCWVISATSHKTVIYCTTVSCMRTRNFSNLNTSKLYPVQIGCQSTSKKLDAIQHLTSPHVRSERIPTISDVLMFLILILVPYHFNLYILSTDRDSSVGTATRYRLDGPGIESRRGEIFRTRSDRPLGPPSLLYNG